MHLDRFRYYTEWHHRANERTYDAPADPWKLLRVSPADVECYNSERRLDVGLGRVRGGPWDRDENCKPLTETATYRGLKQRFEDGRDWEETALYRRAKRGFENGERVRGYESLEEYRNVRCEYVDELFRKIRREGYRPNERATHEKPTDDNPFEDAYAHHLEPLVVVGRSGEIYWTEGYHRLAIASILDVDEIPVYVLCRHEQWQRVRDDLRGTPAADRPPELEAHLDHPDVEDVIA